MQNNIFEFIKISVKSGINDTIIFNEDLTDQQLNELTQFVNLGNQLDNNFFRPSKIILLATGKNIESFLLQYQATISRVIYINLNQHTDYTHALISCRNFKLLLNGINPALPEQQQEFQKQWFLTDVDALFYFMNDATLDNSQISRIFLNVFSDDGIYSLLKVAELADYKINDIIIDTAKIILTPQECNIHKALTKVAQTGEHDTLVVNYDQDYLQFFNSKPNDIAVNSKLTFANIFKEASIITGRIPNINLNHVLPYVDSLDLTSCLTKLHVYSSFNHPFIAYIPEFLTLVESLTSLELHNNQQDDITAGLCPTLPLILEGLTTKPNHIRHLRFNGFDKLTTFADSLTQLITSPQSNSEIISVDKYPFTAKEVNQLFESLHNNETNLKLKALTISFDYKPNKSTVEATIKNAFSQKLILEKLSFTLVKFDGTNIIEFTDKQLICLLTQVNQHQPQLKSLGVLVNAIQPENKLVIIEKVNNNHTLFNLTVFIQPAVQHPHDKVTEQNLVLAFKEHNSLLFFNAVPTNNANYLQATVNYIRDKLYEDEPNNKLNQVYLDNKLQIKYALERETLLYDFAAEHPKIDEFIDPVAAGFHDMTLGTIDNSTIS